jgi:hypothetical protein
MELLDLTGLLPVFWSASKCMEQQGRHGYAWHTVSLNDGPIVTAEGGIGWRSTPLKARCTALVCVGIPFD